MLKLTVGSSKVHRTGPYFKFGFPASRDRTGSRPRPTSRQKKSYNLDFLRDRRIVAVPPPADMGECVLVLEALNTFVRYYRQPWNGYGRIVIPQRRSRSDIPTTKYRLAYIRKDIVSDLMRQHKNCLPTLITDLIRRHNS